MILLNPVQLMELEEAVKSELSLDSILEKIALYNRTGKLQEFLGMIGLGHLLDCELVHNPKSYGKIVVLGQTNAKIQELIGVAKKLKIKKDRFEFCLDYNDIKTYNFDKLKRFDDKYAVVLVGPMPHMVSGTDDFSSAITRMEQEEGFPEVVRLGGNGLKITKTSFSVALEMLKSEHKIVA